MVACSYNLTGSSGYMLDEYGERIKLPSGEWKSRKVYTVDWNDQTKAEQWRKGWADMQNKYLQQNGIAERVDHRSYERQGNGLLPMKHLGVAASQMEKKGIATDKGNHNRQVAITNSEIKQTKARIRKLKNWVYAQPIQNTPSFIEIMGGVANGKNLQSQWQRIRNLKTSAKVLNFLVSNKITDMDEFCNKVVQIHERLRDVSTDIQKTERRLDTLVTHLAHVENLKTHKAVYQKYKSLAPKTDPVALNSINPFTKSKATKEHEVATKKQDAYYDKHVDEIQVYETAKRYLDGMMNSREKLPTKEWQDEQKTLLAKRYGLCENYYIIKDEIKSVETLRRSVENLMQEDLQAQKTQMPRTQDKAL